MRLRRCLRNSASFIVCLEQKIRPEIAAHNTPDRGRDRSIGDGRITNFSEAHSGRNIPNTSKDIARCFLRLANLGNEIFERIGRYEAALWRQVAQTLLTLEMMRR